jgi:hypothetical protein
MVADQQEAAARQAALARWRSGGRGGALHQVAAVEAQGTAGAQ